MAVTLTRAELSAALRLSDDAVETAQADRLLDYSTAALAKHAPDAPAVASNEACIRLCAYLFDQPHAGMGMAYADALRSSGAHAIVSPWRLVNGAVAGA